MAGRPSCETCRTSNFDGPTPILCATTAPDRCRCSASSTVSPEQAVNEAIARIKQILSD
jgi:hypothetical protein